MLPDAGTRQPSPCLAYDALEQRDDGGDVAENRRWPRTRFDNLCRETVLDTGMALWALRRSLVDALAHGQVAGCRVVAVGEDINPWMWEASADWMHLLSVRPTASVDQLLLSLPGNRERLAGGATWVSVFDYERLDDDARQLIVNETAGTYLFACTEVQFKIANRSSVLLSGPVCDGEQSVMVVRHPPVLEAALRHWNAVMASAFHCGEERATAPELTQRQWDVVNLLRQGLTDEAIARALGVSVRTVRAEVAQVLEALQARSRFSAGFHLGRLGVPPR